jgi:hypothetical protein
MEKNSGVGVALPRVVNRRLEGHVGRIEEMLSEALKEAHPCSF